MRCPVKLRSATFELSMEGKLQYSNYERLFDLVTSIPALQTNLQCATGPFLCDVCRYHSFWSTSGAQYVGAVCWILMERITVRMALPKHFHHLCAPVLVSLSDVHNELIRLKKVHWAYMTRSNLEPLRCVDSVFYWTVPLDSLVSVWRSLEHQHSFKDLVIHILRTGLFDGPNDMTTCLPLVSDVTSSLPDTPSSLSGGDVLGVSDSFRAIEMLDKRVPEALPDLDQRSGVSFRKPDNNHAVLHVSSGRRLIVRALRDTEMQQVSQEAMRQLAIPYCPSLTSSKSSGYRAFRSAGLTSKNRDESTRSQTDDDMMSLISSTDAMSIAS